jgi:hypothetical protein
MEDKVGEPGEFRNDWRLTEGKPSHTEVRLLPCGFVAMKMTLS